jgi:hypothetical protein
MKTIVTVEKVFSNMNWVLTIFDRVDVSNGRSLSAHSGSFSTSSGDTLDGDPSPSSDDRSFSKNSQSCTRELARHKLPSKEVLMIFLKTKAVVWGRYQ